MTQRDDARLSRVVGECRRLPTDYLVYEMILRTEHGDEAFEHVAAACFAFDLITAYVEWSDRLDEVRERLSQEKQRLLEEYHGYYVLQDAQQAANRWIHFLHSDRKIQIVWHQISTTYSQVKNLFDIVLSVLDEEMAQEDVAFFKLFREFRHHFKHIYSKLPGGSDSHGMKTMVSRTEQGDIRIGYRVDDEGNVIVETKNGPLHVPITSVGHERFMDIRLAEYERIRQLAPDKLQKQFTTHPETIPAVDDIGKGLAHFIGDHSMIQSTIRAPRSWPK